MVKITEEFVEDTAGFVVPEKKYAGTPHPIPLTPEQFAEAKAYREECARQAAIREGLLAHLKRYLRTAGVKIEISGCGCCDSPTVTFVDDGETIEVLNANVSTLG